MRRAVRADMSGLRGADAQVREILEKADVVIREQVRHYRKVLRRVTWVDVEDIQVHAQYAAIEAHLSYSPDRACSLLSWTKRIVRARLHDVASAILDPTQAVYKAHLAGVPHEQVSDLAMRVREVAIPTYGIAAAATDLTHSAHTRHVNHYGEVSSDRLAERDVLSPEELVMSSTHVEHVLATAARVLTPREHEVLTAELEAARHGTTVIPIGRTKQAHSAARKRAFSRLRAELAKG
jgi:hypothetical protein